MIVCTLMVHSIELSSKLVQCRAIEVERSDLACVIIFCSGGAALPHPLLAQFRVLA
jgi:hypothetical protein